jgi:gamma-glutamyltranspeptidase/glutathione hydrolase
MCGCLLGSKHCRALWGFQHGIQFVADFRVEELRTATTQPGPKATVTGMRAVCSSDNPIVTHTALKVMRAGGNAIDAAISACMVQAAVEPFMTNHAGIVVLLYWEATTGRTYQLNATGTFPPYLAPFHPVGALGGYAPPGAPGPSACIPGFIPGLGEMHRRFGTRPWAELCEDAIDWAETGHPVSAIEHMVYTLFRDFYVHWPEGRAFFMPDGELPAFGTQFRSREMAKTLRRLAQEGPSYFTKGAWAQHFVARANELGWPIELFDMEANPPRWQEPLQWTHGDYRVVQLAPPERQGVYCALVLGILDHLGIAELEPNSADELYYLAHTLRWAERECGYLHDPHIFEVPLDVWLDSGYHAMAARVISSSVPKANLHHHVELTSSIPALVASGAIAGSTRRPRQPAGSCELAIVDSDGNWVQMMNTLQSGGIPCAVVDGIPMVGSHSSFGHMAGAFDSWLIPGARIRSTLGCTMLMRDSRPVLSLGTPGNVYCTVPQVLRHLLVHKLDPYTAISLPRMLPLSDEYEMTIESRISLDSRIALTRRGLHLNLTPPYDINMGSFQVASRDVDTGLLMACADPRRGGTAAGIP